jgi:hypothetical protein
MASEEIAKELAEAKLEATEDVVTPWVSETRNSFRHQFRQFFFLYLPTHS